MKHFLRSGILCVLATASAFAAIDGTVVNKTTRQPQANVPITLVKPGQGGMKTLGQTVSDASGRFAFPNDQPGGGPQLLQANYGGVNYNKLMTPNVPTSAVELDVYEATPSPALVRVAERMLIVDPTISQISVAETIIMQNTSDRTYRNDKLGGWRFYLPPAANGQVRISAQGPQGMPLPRPAEKTEKNDIFRIDFPIKPGETQFEISYVLPAGSPFTFHSEIVNVPGMIAAPLRIVSPQGVTLSGADLQEIGVEPKTQATIYNVLAKDAFHFDIKGTGSLHAGDDATAPGEDEAPQVSEGAPKVYDHLGWLTGCLLGIMALGALVLFRGSPVRSI